MYSAFSPPFLAAAASKLSRLHHQIIYKKYVWHIFCLRIVVSLRKATLYNSPPKAVGDNPDMATDSTLMASPYERTPQRVPCPVCLQEHSGRFYHPQDVINKTLHESGTTDDTRDALAFALYWLEAIVSQLVHVSMTQATPRKTAQRRTGT